MEINRYSVAISIGLGILVIWVWKIVNYVWLRPKKMENFLRKQGLKGNPYRLWHGDLRDVKKMTQEAQSKPIPLTNDVASKALPFHHHLTQEYGKNCFMWNGSTPNVIITDHNMIKKILFKHHSFPKLLGIPNLHLLASGLAFYNGSQWSKHRKLLNPAFKFEKLKNMLPAMLVSCEELVQKWEKMLAEKDDLEIDVLPYVEKLTADVISRTAFGSSYEEGRKVFQLQIEQAKLIFQFNYANQIPGWRFLPTKRNKRMKEVHGEVCSILKALIKKREEEIKERGFKNNDLLDLLLESNLREIQEHGNNKGAGMSIEEVIDECKLFYFAGQDTTSNLIAWTIVMLGAHQTWQARAREEVFQVFGNNKPDFEKLSQLKTVTMILYEVLRLYPPATVMDRQMQERVELEDLTLLPGMQINMPIILIHHDAELWGDDVNEFKPERFADGIAEATKNLPVFFPFSSGPRTCIGQNFAMVEARLAIATIVQRFSFELSPSYAHAPFPLIMLQPRRGVHLIMRRV